MGRGWRDRRVSKTPLRGRADFVAHHREKCTLGASARFGGLHCRLECRLVFSRGITQLDSHQSATAIVPLSSRSLHAEIGNVADLNLSVNY